MTTQPDDDPLAPLEGQPAEQWDVDALWARVRADTIEAPVRPRRFGAADRIAPRRRRAGWIVGGLIAAGLGGFLILNGLRSTAAPARVAQAPAREYRTGIGERATIQLAEGSVVVLAPASALRIAEGSREVTLRGQASFTVRHDERAPFRVHTTGGTVEDIGTKFDVSAYDSAKVVVIVSEGEVALRRAGSGDAPTHLVAGQSGAIEPDGVRRERRPVSETAWAEGRLVFTAQPLGDVLQSLARWYDLDIRVSPELRSRAVTAEFAAQRPREMIESLAAAVGATVTQSGKVVTLTGRRR